MHLSNINFDSAANEMIYFYNKTRQPIERDIGLLYCIQADKMTTICHKKW